jgi:hypothetical protein
MLECLKAFFAKKSTESVLVSSVLIAYYFYSFGKTDIVSSEDDVHLFSALNLKLPLEKFGNLGYYLFLFIVSKFTHNPLGTLFLGYFIISTLAFVSLYFALKKHSQSFFIAFFISTCFLFSDFQLLLVPKLTYLNFIIICLGLFYLDSKKDTFQNYFILSICVLVNAYVARPEFVWFLAPTVLLTLFSHFKHRPKRSQTISLFGLLCSIIVLYWLGGGLYPAGYLREIFIQHFFDNYEVWTGKHFDLADEFGQFNAIYGKVESDFQVFTANSGLLFKHSLYNFKNLILGVLKVFKSTFYDVFVGIFSSKTKYFIVVVLLILGLIIDFKNSFKSLKTNLSLPKPLLKFIIWLLLPCLLLVLVIFPREHFVFLLLPFAFLGLSHLLKSISLRQDLFSRLGLAALVSAVSFGIFLKFPLKANHPNNVDFYNFLNYVKLDKPLKMLSNDNFGYLYFGQNFERVGWNPAVEAIVDKVKAENIDLISIYRLDLEVPETRAFVDSLHIQTGYIKINNFEAQKRYLWVKPELISKFQ